MRTRLVSILVLIILLLSVSVAFSLASWKTYTNKTYAFQIKYPRNFTLEIDKHGDEFSIFSIKDQRGVQYFNLAIEEKTEDFKEPSGPYPIVETSYLSSYDVTKDFLNGISGYRSEGEVEGGGGSFDMFYFVREDKIWYLDLSAILARYDTYSKQDIVNVDRHVYQAILDSFKLI
jgi:hypothetical protein